FLLAVPAIPPDAASLVAGAGVALAKIAPALDPPPAGAPLPVLAWGELKHGDERSARSFDALTVRHVQSRERLVDLVAFYAHRRVARLPDAQLAVLEALHQSDSPL